MTIDTQWVEDVKRWCLSEEGHAAKLEAAAETEPVGYEAADPGLLAPQWPDAPASRNVAEPT